MRILKHFDFKTFQVYSSYASINLDNYDQANFKTFQVYSSWRPMG